MADKLCYNQSQMTAAITFIIKHNAIANVYGFERLKGMMIHGMKTIHLTGQRTYSNLGFLIEGYHSAETGTWMFMITVDPNIDRSFDYVTIDA